LKIISVQWEKIRFEQELLTAEPISEKWRTVGAADRFDGA